MSDSDFEYDMEEYSDQDFSSDEGETLEGDTSMGNEDSRHTVPHKSHTTADLTRMMASQAKEISDVLKFTENDTITLLHHYKWNAEKLMEDYMENPGKTLSDAGLKVENGKNKQKRGKRHYSSASEFTCMICCEDEQDSYCLGCGHEYCLKCYVRYVMERVQKGSIIRCPSCDVALDRSDVDAICGTGVNDQLLESSIKLYVERRKTFKWCPAPDCDVVVEVLDPMAVSASVSKFGVPVATCSRDHQFCLSCSMENHIPCPCECTSAWIKKCKDDSETVKWITTNTKSCGKCGTSIEKNGGCNHMTCGKCRHEFCWICNGDWRAHGYSYYQCNRYKDPVNTHSKTSAKESLDRYLHYYNFFQEHDKSTRLDSKRCTEVEESVKLLQESSGISWIEAQFLGESANALLRSRRVLKWSYVFAYYCDRTTFVTILEGIQARLASSVEALSKVFETSDPLEIVNKKMEFMSKSRQAFDAQKAMISCTNEAITNGTLNIKRL